MGGQRSIKIKFWSQATAEETIMKSWKLSYKVEYKNIWIKKYMNEEDRTKIKELINEAKEKNERRKEEK